MNLIEMKSLKKERVLLGAIESHSSLRGNRMDHLSFRMIHLIGIKDSTHYLSYEFKNAIIYKKFEQYDNYLRFK